MLSPQTYRKTRNLHRMGDSTARPAADTVLKGTLYYSTDLGITERSNGTIWETYTDAGGGSGALVPHADTHEPGGTDVITDAAWTTQSNFFQGDQSVDGDVIATEATVPATQQQKDKINQLIGDATGSRMLMSTDYLAGLSLRHDGTQGRISSGNYDTQTYQPLIIESREIQFKTGDTPVLNEYVRIHPSGGVSVGWDHTDPGIGIVSASKLVLLGPDPHISLAGIAPLFKFIASDQPLNKKIWRLYAYTDEFRLDTVTDDGTSIQNIPIIIKRSGDISVSGGLATGGALTAGAHLATLNGMIYVRGTGTNDVALRCNQNQALDVIAADQSTHAAIVARDIYLTGLHNSDSLNVRGLARCETGVYEYNRGYQAGNWIPFTPSIGGGITLSTNYGCQYMLIGKTMFIGFYLGINSDAVSFGQFYLPAGASITNTGQYVAIAGCDSTTNGNCMIQIPAEGGNLLRIYKDTNGTLLSAGLHIIAAVIPVRIA